MPASVVCVGGGVTLEGRWTITNFRLYYNCKIMLMIMIITPDGFSVNLDEAMFMGMVSFETSKIRTKLRVGMSNMVDLLGGECFLTQERTHKIHQVSHGADRQILVLPGVVFVPWMGAPRRFGGL